MIACVRLYVYDMHMRYAYAYMRVSGSGSGSQAQGQALEERAPHAAFARAAIARISTAFGRVVRSVHRVQNVAATGRQSARLFCVPL